MASPNPTNWMQTLTEFGQFGNQPKNTNLASSTNFRFMCDKVAGVTYFCTSATTPSFSGKPTSYHHLFAANDIKFPGGRSPSDLSIRFIVNEDFSNYMEMVRWQRSGVPYRDFKEIQPEYRGNRNDGRLLLLNNKKNPVIMMSFSNLIPTQISGFTLSHTESDPTPISATVTFVFDAFRIDPVS